MPCNFAHPMWAAHLICDKISVHEMTKVHEVHSIKPKHHSLKYMFFQALTLLISPGLWAILLSLYHSNSWPHSLVLVIAYAFSCLPFKSLIDLHSSCDTPRHNQCTHIHSLTFIPLYIIICRHPWNFNRSWVFQGSGWSLFHPYNPRIDWIAGFHSYWVPKENLVLLIKIILVYILINFFERVSKNDLILLGTLSFGLSNF